MSYEQPTPGAANFRDQRDRRHSRYLSQLVPLTSPTNTRMEEQPHPSTHPIQALRANPVSNTSWVHAVGLFDRSPKTTIDPLITPRSHHPRNTRISPIPGPNFSQVSSDNEEVDSSAVQAAH